MIEQRTVNALKCDACGNVKYTKEDNVVLTGFSLTIEDHAADVEYELYVCKPTHIGKAVRELLTKRGDGSDNDASHSDLEYTEEELRAANANDITNDTTDDDRELSFRPVIARGDLGLATAGTSGVQASARSHRR